MTDDQRSARHEQFIIDSEIRRSEWAMRRESLIHEMDCSDDRIRDSKHRLTICWEDLHVRPIPLNCPKCPNQMEYVRTLEPGVFEYLCGGHGLWHLGRTGLYRPDNPPPADE